ncbi:MAG: peptide chain release factor 1 [Prochloraceae cyanobacterium]|nr:peptide chain release factor 1 [Prochloraceae cyanobacterium]
MNDFWYRFKSQPWRNLGLASALTVTLAALAEILLVLCNNSSKICHDSILFMFQPPLGQVFVIGAAVGVGALGVYLCENWERVAGVSLNTASLWSLVLCLMLAIGIKSFLLNSLILDFSQVSLIGIMVGVFWKGRPYWR